MPVNRITVLFWAAGFALVIGGVSHLRVFIGLAFLLGSLSFLLLISGAIHVHNEQRRDALRESGDDEAK